MVLTLVDDTGVVQASAFGEHICAQLHSLVPCVDTGAARPVELSVEGFKIRGPSITTAPASLSSASNGNDVSVTMSPAPAVAEALARARRMRGRVRRRDVRLRARGPAPAAPRSCRSRSSGAPPCSTPGSKWA